MTKQVMLNKKGEEPKGPFRQGEYADGEPWVDINLEYINPESLALLGFTVVPVEEKAEEIEKLPVKEIDDDDCTMILTINNMIGAICEMNRRIKVLEAKS